MIILSYTPTTLSYIGAGKTKLSIELAKALNGEIINADALQVRAIERLDYQISSGT